MANNICEKCKLKFDPDELYFDGWYLLCSTCLVEINKLNTAKLIIETAVKIRNSRVVAQKD